MTSEEFVSISTQIFGDEPGWVPAVARLLQINERTAERYAGGYMPVNDGVARDLVRIHEFVDISVRGVTDETMELD